MKTVSCDANLRKTHSDLAIVDLDFGHTLQKLSGSNFFGLKYFSLKFEMHLFVH